MKEKIKAWVTTYALSSGIFETEGEVYRNTDGDEVFRFGVHAYGYARKNAWHRTKESAIKQAEVMRMNKIDSLKKSLERLENLRFA